MEQFGGDARAREFVPVPPQEAFIGGNPEFITSQGKKAIDFPGGDFVIAEICEVGFSGSDGATMGERRN